MSDKKHLEWVYDRMVNVYGEDKNKDFVIKLKNIIDNFDNDPSLFLPDEEFNPTDALECIFESDKWCFVASVILRDDAATLNDHYPDPSIEVTDKRSGKQDSWTKEFIDNPNWMVGVLNNNPESMGEAREMFDEGGLKEFRTFLRHLVNKGWLVNE